MTVKAIPEGYHSVTPYIAVDDAAAAIRFYEAAFGATQTMRLDHAGRVAHAEVRIGDSLVMLSDEWPEYGVAGPKTRGGPTASFRLFVEDVDAAFARALAAGGTEERPVADQFYGDRAGSLVDPFGHRWTLATHIEDVSAEEAERRMRDHAAGA
jgi:PhnB protein